MNVTIPPTNRASAERKPTPKYLGKLLETLSTRFDETELRTLCFSLGVEYDSLPGEGTANKSRELIAFLERRQRTHELVVEGRRLRRDILWPKPSEPEPSEAKLPVALTVTLVALVLVSAGVAVREYTRYLSYRTSIEAARTAGEKQALVASLAIPSPSATHISTPTSTPTPFPTNTPTPTPLPVVRGKVCQIKDGWDEGTIFLQQTDLARLRLLIRSKVNVTVLDTKLSAPATLGLYTETEQLCCAVRASEALRDAWGVNEDIKKKSVCERPDRVFYITSISPP